MQPIPMNPYRFTAKMTPGSLIEIAGKQYITAEEWCEREVKRLTDKGVPAQVVRQGNRLVWCCRGRAGVISTSDVEEDELQSV